jgi:hypothetical protein
MKQLATTDAAKVGAAKTVKLKVEKKKNRKGRMSPPPAVETPVIPTPPTREVEFDEEDEATDDPSVVEDRTTRRLLEKKTTEDDLHQGMEAQRATAGAQARMPVLIKVRPFNPKLCAPATVRYGRRAEGLLLTNCC